GLHSSFAVSILDEVVGRSIFAHGGPQDEASSRSLHVPKRVSQRAFAEDQLNCTPRVLQRCNGVLPLPLERAISGLKVACFPYAPTLVVVIKAQSNIQL